MYYQYDSHYKNVLIRTAQGRFPEILHKGDKQWNILAPKPNDPDEMYTRAVYLGGGCWERLDDVEEDDVEAILKKWGYEVAPPEADGVLMPEKEADEMSDNIGLFEGKLKKLRIDSNCICYGPCPLPDDETEQHLTINADGGVWLTRLSFEKGPIEKTNFKIDADTVKNLFEVFEKRFSQEHDICFVTDIGSWEMILTNEEGKEFHYDGPLTEGAGDVVRGLSDMVRTATGRDDLFVFDG